MKTKNWIATAIAAIAAAILPACDSVVLQDIKPGFTTAVELRAKMGNPGFEFRNEDGSVTWEYSRQPAGVHCYMITLGPDQIVRSLDQVLTEANYAKAREGMTRDQIRRLLGRPASSVIFDNLREEVWEWHIEGTPHNEETYLNVFFDTSSGLLKKAGKRVAMKG
ncbi:MAG: outer membrane protein assembly factor BamE [Dechloromonas sp.]|nr:outer membrane protein assembly factor BamE [Dechloromonas sp.]